MVLEFELVFCSSMGYVYLQLQDKIFQKFHMQSLYLIHPVKVPMDRGPRIIRVTSLHETINLFSKWTIVRPSCFAPNERSALKNSRPRYISALKKVVPDISRPKKSPLQ